MVRQDTTQPIVDLKLPFPWKLHKLLESTDDNKTSHIISWLADGTSFKVHKPKTFTDEVMPAYFSQTKFNSFRRQCYIYGFRLRRDGAFFHPDFRRGNLEACMSLRRNQQEDRRRKKERSAKETSFGTINCQDGPSCHHVSSHSNNLLNVVSRGGPGGDNILPAVTSSTSTSLVGGPTNITASGAAVRALENASFCSIKYESDDEIMDLADKIFEDNHVFDESYSLALELDFHFHNVQLESLDELFLSEMTTPPLLTLTERNNGTTRLNHQLVAL